MWAKTAESFLTLGLAGTEIQYSSKEIQLNWLARNTMLKQTNTVELGGTAHIQQRNTQPNQIKDRPHRS